MNTLTNSYSNGNGQLAMSATFDQDTPFPELSAQVDKFKSELAIAMGAM